MFLKPFKIKSKTAIKGSDRKKLRSEFGRQYANLQAEQLSEVIPNKEEMTVMKIVTHAGDNTTVYCLQKNPILFEIGKQIYPTVYVLWRCPDLLPAFTTWPEVFTKLVGGADLMLPGIIVKGNVSPAALGNLQKADACSVILRGNRAPVAVGQTALSSTDMIAAAMRGKGVKILHTYRDQLWAVGNNSELPFLEILPEPMPGVGDNHNDINDDSRLSADEEQDDAVTIERSTDVEQDDTEATQPGCCGHGVADGLARGSTEDFMAVLSLEAGKREEKMEEDGNPGKEESEQTEDKLEYQDEMDSLLVECFLSALKSQVKKADLPLLISKLLKVYMQPLCPRGERLDVKKSSYKKMSAFVKAMQEQGVVTVKQLTKGVDSIVDIHRDCDILRRFIVVERETTDEEAKDASSQGYQPPQVSEMFIVTSATLPLFRACRHGKKGDAFSQHQVRQALTDYIRENELPTTRGAVTLDPLLSEVLLARSEYMETLPWEEVFSRGLARMSVAYQIAFPGQRPLLKKGQVNPIRLNIVQRASNKKVTLIHNLETFGIDPEEFAHNVQVNMACSSSISPLPGKNQGMEVLIQGNQINYIASLLIDKYHLPRKFIQGLEKAPKSVKKKR